MQHANTFLTSSADVTLELYSIASYLTFLPIEKSSKEKQATVGQHLKKPRIIRLSTCSRVCNYSTDTFAIKPSFIQVEERFKE